MLKLLHEEEYKCSIDSGVLGAWVGLFDFGFGLLLLLLLYF